MRPTVYTRIRGAADPIARRFGHYTAYDLDHELVKVVERPPEVVATDLRAGGYESFPLESAKRHPETGELHHYGLRRVCPVAPEAQYHVHLWPDGHGGTEVHSHYEFRPDPVRIGCETWGDVAQRLRLHYRPGETYHPGASGSVVRDL